MNKQDSSSSSLYATPGRRTLIAILFALFTIPFLLQGCSPGVGHSDERACKTCHTGAKAKELGLEDFYAKLATYKFLHKALEKGCRRCHMRSEASMGRWWMIMGPVASGEQVFFLTELSPEGSYEVELEVDGDKGGRVKIGPMSFVPSKLKITGKNEGRAPTIKDVDVIEVKHSVFNEAVIRWTTDVPSNTIVEYGFTPEYGKVVKYDKVFTTEHRIQISGLNADTTYHFRVVSRDIFGNASVSEGHTIDTAKQVSNVVILDEPSPADKMKATLFRVNRAGDVAVRIFNDTRSRVFVRVRELSIFGAESNHGLGLKSGKALTINNCVDCHSFGITHPVGVKSRSRETSIPPNLPTIEDGMITCVTCHDPHGGEQEKLSRLPAMTDLCVQCHTGYPVI